MCIPFLATLLVAIAYVMEVALPELDEFLKKREDRKYATRRELEALRIKYGKKV